MFLVLSKSLKEWTPDDPVFLEHRERMFGLFQDGTFLLSGRRTDENGGILLDYGDDEARLRGLLETDEFWKQGYSSHELIQFRLLNADPASSLASLAEFNLHPPK